MQFFHHSNLLSFSITCLLMLGLGENKKFLEFECWHHTLDWCADQVSVFLDLAGNAHVDVLITNRDDHTANNRWIDLRCEMNGLV